jgi:GT2 family glycosyltransferase
MQVIMPVYNTCKEIHDLTEMAIESLKPDRLILIDNGSTFARGYLADIADVYIRNKQNMGYPYAVNQGLKAVESDLVCITNNDIRVPDNIYRVALEILQDKEIGSVHFKMIPYDQEFTFGDKVWKTGKERWCTSSFFIIRREAIPEGGYDENYGMGGYDDWDFWKRVRDNGWETAYTNRSSYQHFGSWTLSKVPESEKGQANGEYFKKKHGKYAEDIWNKLYPEQMKQDYWEGME